MKLSKSFSTDWTTHNFPAWSCMLSHYDGREIRILEIGSWEGRSALYFLNRLPLSKITCIDTWQGSEEHRLNPVWAMAIGDSERRFDSNLSEFNGRVEKIKTDSHAALSTLAAGGRKFDITYVDGSHKTVDVYDDGMLSWPMVKSGGLLIFDDYAWTGMPDEEDRPRQGVDAFLKASAGQYAEVMRDYQIAIIKIT